jgi:hypothetical protein
LQTEDFVPTTKNKLLRAGVFPHKNLKQLNKEAGEATAMDIVEG